MKKFIKYSLLALLLVFSTSIFAMPNSHAGFRSNLNITDTYIIPPPPAPYMPDNRLGDKVPFEWHKSEREKTDEYNKGRDDHAKFARSQPKSPTMIAYNDLRAMGLSDAAAKAQLQYQAGIRPDKPRIINGELS